MTRKTSKRTTTLEIEKEIVVMMLENPAIEHSIILEKYNISRRVLQRIRTENGLYHGFTKHMSKIERQNMLDYMRQNPLTTYDEMTKLFGYTIKQLEKVRHADKSLPNLMKVTKRKKNNSYLTPETEAQILKYMIDNPMSTYNTILPKFNCSVRQVERLRKEHNLPSIKRRPATTHQSILRKEGKRYCPRCNEIKFAEQFPPYRESCCLECESKRSNDRMGVGNLENFIKAKIKNCHQRRNWNIPVEITFNDVIGIYNKQEGKCYYSGRQMVPFTNNSCSISIERLDSDIGYIPENIVLCCTMVNYMKQEYEMELFLQFCNDISRKHPREQTKCYPF
jgi:hypothetical protein